MFFLNNHFIYIIINTGKDAFLYRNNYHIHNIQILLVINDLWNYFDRENIGRPYINKFTKQILQKYIKYSYLNKKLNYVH